jgi:hypothetical protein
MKFGQLKPGMTLYLFVNKTVEESYSAFVYFIKAVEPHLVRYHLYIISKEETRVNRDLSYKPNWDQIHSDANEITSLDMQFAIQTLFGF